MALRGGTAGKLGDHYEILWTVRAILEVLDEHASSILIEEAGVDSAEFRLQTPAGRQYHQTKRQPSGRDGWSAAKLAEQGVLASALRVLRDTDTTFHFVSQGSADRVRELHERASKGLPHADLSDDLIGVLAALERHLNLDRDQTWQLLKRFELVAVSHEFLRQEVERRLGFALDGDPASIRADLADLVMEKINQELRADEVWTWLRARGWQRRHWAKDARSAPAIDAANDHYLASLAEQDIAGLTLTRPATDQVLGLIKSGAQVVLVTGTAGAGKSIVLRAVVEDLRGSGMPTLAFRADTLNPNQDIREVGRQILGGLVAPPAEVLSALAGSRQAVLVLDQLDAVSVVSGRNPQFFHCIAAIVEDAVARGITVVVGCREFDLKADYRLAELASKILDDSKVDVGTLSPEQVIQALAHLELVGAHLTPRQLELLRTPLHLRLLAGARGGRNVLDFQTATDLFGFFWDRKQSAVRERLGPGIRWSEFIAAVCDDMSTHQSLTVPTIRLDAYSEELAALASEHVVQMSSSMCSFFHQSFFDYAFARTFAGRSESVTQFLLDHEQGLFRRAQLRQILLFLREADPTRYLKELGSLLNEPQLRFHLKEVAFGFLSEVLDPRDDEWEILAPILEGDRAHACWGHAWRTLRVSLPWFRLGLTRGTIGRWLRDDGALGDEAMTVLGAWQREEPDAIAELLQPYIAAPGAWPNRLRWIATVGEVDASRRFFELVIAIVTHGYLESGGLGALAIAYSLPERNPAWAAELIAADLARRLTKASAEDAVPKLGDPSTSAPEPAFILRTAVGDPLSFVREVLPPMLEFMERTAQENGSNGSRADRTWPYVFAGDAHDYAHALQEGMASAVEKLAHEWPDEFRLIAARLRQGRLRTADWLLARGYIAGGEPFADDAVDFILADPSRLRLGYVDSHMVLSHRLLKAASPFCTDARFAELESRFLNYAPPNELQNDSRARRFRGSTELALLSGLAEKRLSRPVRQRLAELQRKFPGGAVAEPTGIEVGVVQSPISEKVAPRMSDDQWLRAVAKYAVEREWRDDPLIGGPLQLSRVLTAETTNDPMRFAHFAERLPDNTNPVYFEGILNGLAAAGGGLPLEVVERVIHRVHALPGRPCTRAISYLVEPHADLKWSDSVVLLLADCATNDVDPGLDEATVTTGDITTEGLNTGRGAAMTAVAALLRQQPERWPLLEAATTAAFHDPSTAVRACAIYCLRPLLRIQPKSAITLFQEVSRDAPQLVTTHEARRFLASTVSAYFSELRDVVIKMLESPLPAVATVGAAAACLAALEVPEAGELIEVCLQGSASTRLGAAQVLAANVGQASLVSVCQVALAKLFSDDDVEVRRAAARAFDSLHSADPILLEALGHAFLDSPAFDEGFSQMVRMLQATPTPSPALVSHLCERAVSEAGPELADIRTGWAVDSGQLFGLAIRALALASEVELQQRLLTVVDEFLSLQVGDRGALAAYERL